MDKFLSGLILSGTVFAANMAPVFANATADLKNVNGVTVNSVAPKSSLIEIEGRTLTDAEAAKVEGEAFFVPVVIWIGKKAVTHVVKKTVTSSAKHYVNCSTGRVQNCNAQSYGTAIRSGVTFGLWR